MYDDLNGIPSGALCDSLHPKVPGTYPMQGVSITAAYQSLIAAVIERAIDDLKGTGPRCGRKEPGRAMAFILSDDCEAYCLELAINYETIREKAAALYRRFMEKEDAEGGWKNRPGRPAKGLQRVNTRQSPGKPRIATGR